MAIGDRIKEAREAANKTLKELGDDLGVTPQAVFQWENGTVMPGLPRLRAIVRALKVDEQWLLGPEGRALVSVLDEEGLRRTLELEFQTVDPRIDPDYLGDLIETAVAAAQGKLPSPGGLSFDDSVHLSIGRARTRRAQGAPKTPTPPKSS